MSILDLDDLLNDLENAVEQEKERGKVLYLFFYYWPRMDQRRIKSFQKNPKRSENLLERRNVWKETMFERICSTSSMRYDNRFYWVGLELYVLILMPEVEYPQEEN